MKYFALFVLAVSSFLFNSVGACEEWDSVREKSAKIAKTVYDLIEQEGHVSYPTDEDCYDKENKCSKKGWSHLKTPGWSYGVRVYRGEKIGGELFYKHSGLLMSEAIKAFLEGPTVTECLTVRLIVVLKILQEIIGVNNFNTLFAAYEDCTKSKIAFTLCIEDMPSKGKCENGDYLLRQIISDQLISDAYQEKDLGAFLYFINREDYKKWHPLGYARGHNVICVGTNERGEPVYMGFGDPFDVPRTALEISDWFYQQYHLLPTAYEQEILNLKGVQPFPDFLNLLKKCDSIEPYTLEGFNLEFSKRNFFPNRTISYFDGRKIRDTLFYFDDETKSYKLRKPYLSYGTDSEQSGRDLPLDNDSSEPPPLDEDSSGPSCMYEID